MLNSLPDWKEIERHKRGAIYGQSYEILKCVGITLAPSHAPSTFWLDDTKP